MYDTRITRIIELKGRLMEDKERELELCNSRLFIIDNKINEIDDEITARRDKIATDYLRGSEFTILTEYIEFLKETKTRAVEERAQVLVRIAEIRGELTELLREIKILEKLLAKVLAREKKAANRRLQKLLDGVALRTQNLIR